MEGRDHSRAARHGADTPAEQGDQAIEEPSFEHPDEMTECLQVLATEEEDVIGDQPQEVNASVAVKAA